MAATWMEVFKTGTHTSGNGITKTYTLEDLSNMVKKYNERPIKTDKAPLVLGHPKTDDPAYGWAEQLKLMGNKLLAYVDNVTDSVVEAVKAGQYQKISIAIYPDGLLRHIGLLGAMPPAVKGLAPVQFAADLEFTEYIWATDEYRMPTVSRILSGIRDYFIEAIGLEKTNKIIDKSDIDYLNDPATTYKIPVPPEKSNVPLGAINNYSEQEEQAMDEKRFKELEDKVGNMITQFSGLETGINTLTGLITKQGEMFSEQVKVTQAQNKATALTTAKASFEMFAEGLAKDGKILPAEKDSIIEEYTDLLRAEQELTFAEGATLPSEKMKTRLAARQVIISKATRVFADKSRANKDVQKDPGSIEVPSEFSELADRIIPESLDQDAQIMAYAEKHNVSYEVACTAVMGSGK